MLVTASDASWSDDDLKTKAGVTTTQDDRNIQNEVCAAKMTHSVLERLQTGVKLLLDRATQGQRNCVRLRASEVQSSAGSNAAG